MQTGTQKNNHTHDHLRRGGSRGDKGAGERRGRAVRGEGASESIGQLGQATKLPSIN